MTLYRVLLIAPYPELAQVALAAASDFPEIELTVHEGDFAKALELAQKARFSKGGCTAEERRWMEAFVAHFSKRVYKDLSLPKQFSFRLIHLN